MKHVFVINPVAGKKGAAQAMQPDIERAAAKCGVEPIFEMTKAPKDASEIAKRHAAAGEPVRLYAVGGDGTLNEVFWGAYPYENAEVASVPCGFGNDFVRTYGRPEDFLKIEEQILGEAIPIDLMEVDGGICAAITSTGMDADVAYQIPKYKRIPLIGGPMGYILSLVNRMMKPVGQELKITIDGRKFHDHYSIAAICNAQTYGGGFRAAPEASPEDGMLDVMLVKKISRLLIVSIINRFKNGKHVLDGRIIPEFSEYMIYLTAQEVEMVPVGEEFLILNVDGECGPAPRLRAKVLPSAARFVLPKGHRRQD